MQAITDAEKNERICALATNLSEVCKGATAQERMNALTMLIAANITSTTKQENWARRLGEITLMISTNVGKPVAQYTPVEH